MKMEKDLKSPCNIELTSVLDDNLSDLACVEFNDKKTTQSAYEIKICTGKCKEVEVDKRLRKCFNEKNIAANILLRENGILSAKVINSHFKSLITSSWFLSISNHPLHKQMASLLKEEARDISELNVFLYEHKKNRTAKSLQKHYAPYFYMPIDTISEKQIDKKHTSHQSESSYSSKNESSGPSEANSKKSANEGEKLSFDKLKTQGASSPLSLSNTKKKQEDNNVFHENIKSSSEMMIKNRVISNSDYHKELCSFSTDKQFSDSSRLLHTYVPKENNTLSLLSNFINSSDDRHFYSKIDCNMNPKKVSNDFSKASKEKVFSNPETKINVIYSDSSLPICNEEIFASGNLNKLNKFHKNTDDDDMSVLNTNEHNTCKNINSRKEHQHKSDAAIKYQSFKPSNSNLLHSSSLGLLTPADSPELLNTEMQESYLNNVNIGINDTLNNASQQEQLLIYKDVHKNMINTESCHEKELNNVRSGTYSRSENPPFENYITYNLENSQDLQSDLSEEPQDKYCNEDRKYKEVERSMDDGNTGNCHCKELNEAELGTYSNENSCSENNYTKNLENCQDNHVEALQGDLSKILQDRCYNTDKGLKEVERSIDNENTGYYYIKDLNDTSSNTCRNEKSFSENIANILENSPKNLENGHNTCIETSQANSCKELEDKFHNVDTGLKVERNVKNGNTKSYQCEELNDTRSGIDIRNENSVSENGYISNNSENAQSTDVETCQGDLCEDEDICNNVDKELKEVERINIKNLHNNSAHQNVDKSIFIEENSKNLTKCIDPIIKTNTKEETFTYSNNLPAADDVISKPHVCHDIEHDSPDSPINNTSSVSDHSICNDDSCTVNSSVMENEILSPVSNNSEESYLYDDNLNGPQACESLRNDKSLGKHNADSSLNFISEYSSKKKKNMKALTTSEKIMVSVPLKCLPQLCVKLNRVLKENPIKDSEVSLNNSLTITQLKVEQKQLKENFNPDKTVDECQLESRSTNYQTSQNTTVKGFNQPLEFDHTHCNDHFHLPTIIYQNRDLCSTVSENKTNLTEDFPSNEIDATNIVTSKEYSNVTMISDQNFSEILSKAHCKVITTPENSERSCVDKLYARDQFKSHLHTAAEKNNLILNEVLDFSGNQSLMENSHTCEREETLDIDIFSRNNKDINVEIHQEDSSFQNRSTTPSGETTFTKLDIKGIESETEQSTLEQKQTCNYNSTKKLNVCKENLNISDYDENFKSGHTNSENNIAKKCKLQNSPIKVHDTEKSSEISLFGFGDKRSENADVASLQNKDCASLLILPDFSSPELKSRRITRSWKKQIQNTACLFSTDMPIKTSSPKLEKIEKIEKTESKKQNRRKNKSEKLNNPLDNTPPVSNNGSDKSSHKTQNITKNKSSERLNNTIDSSIDKDNSSTKIQNRNIKSKKLNNPVNNIPPCCYNENADESLSKIILTRSKYKTSGLSHRTLDSNLSMIEADHIANYFDSKNEKNETQYSKFNKMTNLKDNIVGFSDSSLLKLNHQFITQTSLTSCGIESSLGTSCNSSFASLEVGYTNRLSPNLENRVTKAETNFSKTKKKKRYTKLFGKRRKTKKVTQTLMDIKPDIGVQKDKDEANQSKMQSYVLSNKRIKDSSDALLGEVLSPVAFKESVCKSKSENSKSKSLGNTEKENGPCILLRSLPDNHEGLISEDVEGINLSPLKQFDENFQQEYKNIDKEETNVALEENESNSDIISIYAGDLQDLESDVESNCPLQPFEELEVENTVPVNPLISDDFSVSCNNNDCHLGNDKLDDDGGECYENTNVANKSNSLKTNFDSNDCDSNSEIPSNDSLDQFQLGCQINDSLNLSEPISTVSKTTENENFRSSECSNSLSDLCQNKVDNELKISLIDSNDSDLHYITNSSGNSHKNIVAQTNTVTNSLHSVSVSENLQNETHHSENEILTSVSKNNFSVMDNFEKSLSSSSLENHKPVLNNDSPMKTNCNQYKNLSAFNKLEENDKTLNNPSRISKRKKCFPSDNQCKKIRTNIAESPSTSTNHRSDKPEFSQREENYSKTSPDLHKQKKFVNLGLEKNDAQFEVNINQFEVKRSSIEVSKINKSNDNISNTDQSFEGQIIEGCGNNKVGKLEDQNIIFNGRSPSFIHIPRPVLPKNACFKFFMENTCTLNECKFSHMMEMDALTKFLGELIPFYTKRGLESLAWQIVERHFMHQKNSFHFSVSVLKPLTKYIALNPELPCKVPSSLEKALKAATLEVLCESGNKKVVFEYLLNVFHIEDLNVKKFMFHTFIRFCDIHVNTVISPFEKVVYWRCIDGLSPEKVLTLKKELNFYWINFHISENNSDMVVKSYHHTIKDEKLEVESFLHITFMYLKFIHKQGSTNDIYPILDYLERKKILDSRIFISISSVLKVHMDKNISFRFFSVMFKLEPLFDVSDCFSLIDLAMQYETALAVNAVSYSIKVCNCLPSIDQVSLILNRMKSDFPVGNLVLLDKLCIGLPRTTLSSVAGSLKSLLTNCPPSRSLEEFYEKIKSKGLNLRTSFNYENNESVECQNPNSIGDVNELVSSVVTNENFTTSSQSEASSVNSHLQDKSYFSDMSEYSGCDISPANGSFTSKREREKFIALLTSYLTEATVCDPFTTASKNFILKAYSELLKPFGLPDIEKLFRILTVSLMDWNISENGNRVHLKSQIKIVSVDTNYEDNKKIVLGLLGTTLITFCSQNNYNNKVASIIITLRGIDIRFHEFQSLLCPAHTQLQIAMFGINSLFQTSNLELIVTIFKEVNWIDETNEDELKEVMKWRLDYVKVTLDLLVKKKQFHQALELCQFLVDLYQFDTRLIGVTSYYNHIDLPSHLCAIGEYVLEKQNCQQFMLKFQNLIYSFIRNGVVIPKFIRELPILQHIFSNTLMQYQEQSSHLSRSHPYVPRRQGRRNYPFRNDVVRNGNNEIIGAVAGPSRIHARVEWPRNHRRFNYNCRRRNFK